MLKARRAALSDAKLAVVGAGRSKLNDSTRNVVAISADDDIGKRIIWGLGLDLDIGILEMDWLKLSKILESRSRCQKNREGDRTVPECLLCWVQSIPQSRQTS